MADGFMNRLTVVRGSRPGPPNLDPTRLAVPAGICEGLRAAYEAGQATRGNLEPAAARTATARVALAVVPWADEAASAAWMGVLHWEIAAIDAGRGGVTARASSQTLKIATLRALCRDAAAPAVAADDVAWAWSFVKASIGEIERGAAENMAGSEHEALVKAIERAIAKAGASGITRSDLNRAAGVSKATPAQRKAALEDLTQTGRAHEAIVAPPGGGRPSSRIKPGRAPGTD